MACDTCGMNDEVAAPTYAGYRFPAASSGHAVWRSFRFALRYRDVAELLAARGVIVTDETVRQWCQIVRAGVCQCAAPTSPAAGRHVAPGCGLHAHRRGDASPLACRRSAG